MKSSQQLQKGLFKTIQPHLSNIHRVSAAFMAFWEALPPSFVNPNAALAAECRTALFGKSSVGGGLWKAWTLEGDWPGFQTWLCPLKLRDCRPALPSGGGYHGKVGHMESRRRYLWVLHSTEGRFLESVGTPVEPIRKDKKFNRKMAKHMRPKGKFTEREIQMDTRVLRDLQAY